MNYTWKLFRLFISLCFFNHSQAAESAKKSRFLFQILRKSPDFGCFFMEKVPIMVPFLWKKSRFFGLFIIACSTSQTRQKAAQT